MAVEPLANRDSVVFSVKFDDRCLTNMHSGKRFRLPFRAVERFKAVHALIVILIPDWSPEW